MLLVIHSRTLTYALAAAANAVISAAIATMPSNTTRIVNVSISDEEVMIFRASEQLVESRDAVEDLCGVWSCKLKDEYS